MVDIKRIIAKEWIKLLVGLLVGVIIYFVVDVIVRGGMNLEFTLYDLEDGWPLLFIPYVLYQLYCSIVWAVKNKK
jgi:hypothetical protein